MNQARLRRNGRRARRALSPGQRAQASRRIADRFLHSNHFLSSDALGCYISVGDEVDTTAIIDRAWRAGKRIFVPVTAAGGSMTFHALERETPLVRNDFGLWEPRSRETMAPEDLDVVVTPLVAFDARCHRIGMGAGYFDRAFAFLGNRQHWFRPKLIGLAFECQRVEKIEPNPWDIRLYRVYTEAP